MTKSNHGGANIGVRLALAALLASAATGVFAADGPAANPAPAAAASTASASAESGLAAVYSDKLIGHRTASGQGYSRDKLAAAHKTLPFGTRVRVTNTKNGKSVVVRINDRGPKQAGRILDLTPRAARAIGIRSHAMAEVTAETVPWRGKGIGRAGPGRAGDS